MLWKVINLQLSFKASLSKGNNSSTRCKGTGCGCRSCNAHSSLCSNLSSCCLGRCKYRVVAKHRIGFGKDTRHTWQGRKSRRSKGTETTAGCLSCHLCSQLMRGLHLRKVSNILNADKRYVSAQLKNSQKRTTPAPFACAAPKFNACLPANASSSESLSSSIRNSFC